MSDLSCYIDKNILKINGITAATFEDVLNSITPLIKTLPEKIYNKLYIRIFITGANIRKLSDIVPYGDVDDLDMYEQFYDMATDDSYPIWIFYEISPELSLNNTYEILFMDLTEVPVTNPTPP